MTPMKAKHIVALAAGIFCSTLAFAQPKFELGKVTVAELEEKQHPKDPTAPAAVLFEKGRVGFVFDQSEGLFMVTDVKMRIKIYKKEGYDYASKAVKYYLPSNYKEMVTFDDAVTYNLENGQVVKLKLKSDGLFDEKVNKYWGRKKITMPGVKEGSVVEFSYRIKSPNFQKIDDWKFQQAIPVNYSEYRVAVPEYFVYQPSVKGTISPKSTVEKSDRNIIFNYKDRSDGMVTRTTFEQQKVSYVETATTYVAEQMPAMKEEVYVNNIENYLSSIGFELSATRFPNMPFKSYSTDWASVVKTIYENEDFGAELNKTGYFEADVKTLAAQSGNIFETISGIYGHVKRNVNWNGYYGYSCNDGVRSAYKNKTGNVAEINLMLTAMLRHAGLDAHPVLVSTRSNGIAYFPNRTAYNYVICAVDTPQGRILLDATEKYACPNVLPLRDLNWFGRLIRKDGTSENIELTPKNLSKEVVYLNYKINADGSVEGKVRNQLTDHQALQFRQTHTATAQDSYVENYENAHGNIEIGTYARENEQDFGKPLLETFDFKHRTASEIINDKIYVTPLLFLNRSENPFKQDKREYPVDFGYPTQNKWTINIEIPDGYTVESLPKPLSLSTGDEVGSFKYLSAPNGNKIQLIMTADINAAILPADYYENIKEFYQKMIEQQNQKIVLVKA